VPQLGGLVVKLQDQWGDHLASTGQVDAAISHFVEAGESLKAARAAVDAENLTRAAPLVDLLQPSEHEDLSARLADLFRASGNLQMATSYYVRAGRPAAAVHMYFDADKFDDATKVQALRA
jgi:intraflagellar transport protein 172